MFTIKYDNLLNKMLFAIIPLRGRVAQLGEHLARIQEVRGSNPLTSTRVRVFGYNNDLKTFIVKAVLKPIGGYIMKRSRYKYPLYFAIVGVMLLFGLLSITGCDGDTAAVTGSITVPDDYSSIQDAIDAAADGDVIVVKPGKYSGSIDFNGKNITLSSSNPEDPEIVATTIIDAGGVNSAVAFKSGESEAAVITGFTITGGSGNLETLEFIIEGEALEVPSYYGGGIIVLNGSSPTITGNVIVDNVAERGGAILSYGSSPIITDNTINDNISTGGGGGIFLADSSATIINNTLSNNVAGLSGGAVAISGSADLPSLIDGNTFSNNRADNGGAFSIFESDPEIKNNTLLNNFSTQAGGGIFMVSSSAVFTANDITDNIAGSAGGGIAIYFGSEPLFENNTIIGNEANDGGGISIYYGSAPLISGNTITDNQARIGGGIEVNEGSSPEIMDNEISGNYAEVGGGGILIQLSEVIITGNTFSNNESRREGGAIYLFVDAVGKIFSNVFESNKSIKGGAIYVDEGATLELNDPDDNTYSDNTPDDKSSF
jgi:parallel beta-helix repeat protein/predicted outer membrane repeat protein